MTWSYFIIFAVVSVVLWAVGAWGAWRIVVFYPSQRQVLVLLFSSLTFL